MEAISIELYRCAISRICVLRALFEFQGHPCIGTGRGDGLIVGSENPAGIDLRIRQDRSLHPERDRASCSKVPWMRNEENLTMANRPLP